VRHTFEALAARARAGPAAGAVRLVAVDGPAGSGKSTLAARLARALGGAPVLDLDDFFAWTDLEGWWPRLEDEVLTPLAAGRDARFRARDWERDPGGTSLGPLREIPAAPALVIDGVSSSRRALAGRLALALWVEAPVAVRRARGLRRPGVDLTGRWDAWTRLEAEFFRADGTRARADLRLDGAPRVPHDPEREVVELEAG
jgi:Cytidylate kinase